MKKPALILSAAMLALAQPETGLAMEGVVTTIKPLHSLAAGVMAGVGEPSLLIAGAGSPHDYTLRPSQAAMLEDARLVFWMGEGLETFLTGSLQTLVGNANVVELSQADGVELLAFREGGPFEAHDHGDEDGHDHSHENDHDHSRGEYDMHIWLDPMNARAIVDEIATILAELDPDNGEQYQTNAETVYERLDGLTLEIEDALSTIENRPFIVFHDAYQYYEARFSFPAAGSITVNPDVMPGARRVSEIRDRVRTMDAACVFAEPQFEPRFISVVSEGTNASTGVLDPYGAELEDGPDAYFDMMRNLTAALTDCLSSKE